MPENLNTQQEDQRCLAYKIKIALELILELLAGNMSDNFQEKIVLTLGLTEQGLNTAVSVVTVAKIFAAFNSGELNVATMIDLLFYSSNILNEDNVPTDILYNANNINFCKKNLINLVNSLQQKFPEINAWVRDQISTVTSTIATAIVDLLSKIKTILSAIVTNVITKMDNFSESLSKRDKDFFPMFNDVNTNNVPQASVSLSEEVEVPNNVSLLLVPRM